MPIVILFYRAMYYLLSRQDKLLWAVGSIPDILQEIPFHRQENYGLLRNHDERCERMSKKIIFCFLVLSLLLLCACGQTQSVASASPVEASFSSEIQSVEETSSASSQPAFQFAALDLQDGTNNPQNIQLCDGYICFLAQDDTTQYACRMRPDGSEMSSVALIDWNENYTVTGIAFDPNFVCYVTTEYLFQDIQGAVSIDTQLHCISSDGTTAFAISLDSDFGQEDGSEVYVAAIAFASDHTIYFSTDSHLYHLDQNGELLNTMDITESTYALLHTYSQQILLWDQTSGDIYSVDETSFSLGSVVLNGSSFLGFYVASADYDLFAFAEDGIWGINLAENTQTLVLTEEELSGIGYAFPVSDGAWLISHTNYINFDTTLYLAQKNDEDNHQEVTTLTLVVSDTETVDDYVQRVVTQFNFEHPNTMILLKEYTDEELKLALTTGDIPDLILFDNLYNWDTVDLSMLEKQMVLEDLSSYLGTELSSDDILPNLLSCLQQDDKIYAIPYGYQFRTIYCNEKYGSMQNWTLSEMIHVAAELPKDVMVEETTQSDFLMQVMQWCLPEFVDESADTCDFENQLFYDLLSVCKNHMPAEYSESGSNQEYLCNYTFSMFGFSSICDIVQSKGNAAVFSGFPSANGGQFAFSPRIAVTTSNQDKQASWDFVCELICSNGITVYESILTSDFDSDITQLEGDYPQDVIATVSEMILNTSTASDYDSLIPQIVVEESAAYFSGDKTAEEVAKLIQNRVMIYLSE